MKTIKNIFWGSTMLLFTACNFLDTTPSDFINPDDFYKDDTEAFMGLTGIYNTLNSSSGYGEKYYQAIGTDDLTYYYTSSTAEVGLPNNNYTANDADLASIWQGLYEGINNANYFLERITDSPVSEANKKMYRGEATFLRAYFYFLLAQSWGDVPLITTAQTNTDNYVPNIKKLAAGHGITTDAVSTYPNSADPTFFTPVSDGLGRIIQKSVEETYAQFLSRVADGRGMSVAAVDSIAQGRVWSGVSALKIGLVDELGGMDDALEKAAELAGLEDYSVDEYPKFPSSMDQLLEMLGGGQKTDDARVRALVGDDMFQMYKAARDASQVKEARVMARVPYGMRLEF